MKKYHLLLILLMAGAARLYNLDAPVLGIRGWRQADTMAMAINFHENGYNLWYPQVDWGGNSPGYIESEFPIYSYITGLTFSFLGVSEISARLLSLFYSLTAIVYFYFFVKEQIDEKTALWSCVFMALIPLNVYMGHTIMPESLLLLCLIAGVYYFSKWLSSERNIFLVLSIVFISLACLIKIPSLYIGLPILHLAWLKYKRAVFAQWKIWLFGMVVIGATTSWYYHAHQIYLENGLTFGIWEYGVDKWGNWDLLMNGAFWKRIFGDHLGNVFFVWIGYPIFIIGLLLPRGNAREFVFDYWLASVLIYLLIVSRGNYVHDYYQLPFTMPIALFLGKVYAAYMEKTRPVAAMALSLSLAGFIILGAYNYSRIYIHSEDPKLSETYELAQLVKEHTEEDALIIAVDNHDPTLFYLSSRKGWHVNSGEQLLDQELLDERIEKGARYLAGRLKSCYDDEQCEKLGNLLDQYTVVFKNKDYFVVRLSD